MTKRNIDIPAVCDKDLRVILSDLGILNQFESYGFQCKYCNQQIGWHNLGAIAMVDSVLVFVCDSAECLDEASMRTEL